MTIRFGCPHCHAIAHVDDQFAGRIASCTRCGESMVVPHESNYSVNPSAAREVTYIEDQRRTSPRRIMIILLLGAAAFLALWVFFEAHTPHRHAKIVYSSATTGSPYQNTTPAPPLRAISVAMQQYYADNGCYPPAYTTDEQGRFMHSWRALLLPYLDYRDQHLADVYRYDEPWDSENNLSLLRDTPAAYTSGWDLENGQTRFVVVVGAASQFPQTMFTPNRGITKEDIKDPLDQTIMVAQCPYAVPWTMPNADLHFDTMTMRFNSGPASIGRYHSTSRPFEVLMADGQTIEFYYRPSILIRQMLQPADGAPKPPAESETNESLAPETVEQIAHDLNVDR